VIATDGKPIAAHRRHGKRADEDGSFASPMLRTPWQVASSLKQLASHLMKVRHEARDDLATNRGRALVIV
jgi:hypothetical protein